MELGSSNEGSQQPTQTGMHARELSRVLFCRTAFSEAPFTFERVAASVVSVRQELGWE